MSNSYTIGAQDQRPWGLWKCTDTGVRYAVKTIFVNAGQKLSLQRHRHRDEHWVVVAGRGTVTRDDETLIVAENQNVFLPRGCKHRMENKGTEALVFVEVQYGDVLDENDIERFEDQYGRS